MKVAIIHDWLTGMRGGERCLKAFLTMYPEADIFTLIHVPASTHAEIDARVKKVSFLQRFPYASKIYRLLLPLYPWAIRSFDLRGYDLIISLSHAAAKNVRVPDGVPHVCYCFTPMRYVWDQARTYFGRMTPLLWPVLARLRAWDRRCAATVTRFVGISSFVAARIRCFYDREAHVIYPPVDSSWIQPATPDIKGEAFLYAGALVPYKRVDLVIDAFNRLGEKLWIVGAGPELEHLKKKAQANIEFFGWVPDHELASFYRRARALVFPAIEDFGLIPLECMAAGRPVIAIHDGALRETLQGVKPWSIRSIEPESASGVFFRKVSGGGPTAQLDSLLSALYYFISHESRFRAETCRAQAERFSPAYFFRSWRALVERQALQDLKKPAYAEAKATAI